MATRRKPTRAKASAGSNGGSGVGNGFLSDAEGEFTGRYLVLFEESKSPANAVKALNSKAGLNVAMSSDYGGDESAWVGFQADSGADALIFEQLGIAVVEAPPEGISAIAAAVASDDNPIITYEPERVVHAIQDVMDLPYASSSAPIDQDYLRGYIAAVNNLGRELLGGDSHAPAPSGMFEPAEVFNESRFTWGLQATRAANSQYTGKGIKVAVLDTGLDLGHPDFVGRSITSASFIPGQTVQDGHGHGTHCIGTSCGVRGPRNPVQMPQYGVAYEADIFAGKVLSNSGSGSDGSILGGIDWAVRNKCEIVSMSLGARVSSPSQPFSAVYEQAAQRALDAGTLIIAAAGNDSSRPGVIWPVSHPANCPSIVAVGAIDARLGTMLPRQVAVFSNGGLNPQGGHVDIAGPGVAVRSTWPRPRLYNTISGTSMATPHVAGIAALYAQGNPSVRGRALLCLLLQRAQRMLLPSRDVGAGFVQAP